MLIGSVRRDGHHAAAPWHFLYFFPLPHGHGSLRPTFGPSCRTVLTAASSPPTRGGCCVAVARGGAAVAAADRGAPNTDADAASAPGSLRISGARRCGARRTGAAAASSLSTGRSHHR